MTSSHRLSLTEAAAAIRSGEISIPQLVEDVLDRADAVEGAVHAMAARHDRSTVMALAHRLHDSVAGATSALHGVPFAVKDMIDTADLPTEGGSAVLAGRRPDEDSPSVRAGRQAGAVLVAKAHTHEFAFGVRTPQTHNPWDLLRTPGGSSGGSAAAVASGSATWALGTDTLGSVRMPAAMCGVVGYKPTTGIVSNRGVLPLAPTLDTIGFLSRTVADARVLATEIAGVPPASPPAPSELRIGVLVPELLGHVEPGVAQLVHDAIERLRRSHPVQEVSISSLQGHVDIGFGLMLPEASAWHRRHLQTPQPPYDPSILSALRSGLEVPAVNYLDALRERSRLRDELSVLFERIDVLVTPSTPYAAPLASAPHITWPDGSTEPLETSMCRFTAAASVAGMPAISVPVGLSQELPVGAQVMAPRHRDADALAVAAELEVRLPLRP